MQQPMFSNQDLRRLIVPLVIEQVLSIAVGMIDVMMISAAGEAAVSGVSLVDMIAVVLINIFAALATGGAVVASQYMGARDTRNACAAAQQLVLASAMISLVITGLALAFQEPLLRLCFGAIEDDVMASALTYFTITALSYPFLAVYNACAALFRSMGNSRVSMVTSLWMNLINIGGNALLLYVFHMGVAGVALATLVSRIVAAAIMLVLILQDRHAIHLPRTWRIRPDRAMIGRILRIGVPNGIENGIFQLGRVAVVSIIAGFGTMQIAANAVANTLDSLGCIPGQAMNLAMITVVGQCVGAGDYTQARRYTGKLMALTYAAGAVVNAAILLCLSPLLGLYQLSDETRQLAATLVWIHDGCAILMWPAAFTLPNALRAAGDVRFPMVVSIFSMAVFRIVFSLILGQGLQWGAVGVWVAMVLDWVFRILFFVVRYARGRWTRFGSVNAPASRA